MPKQISIQQMRKPIVAHVGLPIISY